MPPSSRMPKPAGRAVGVNLAVIGHEFVCRIFGGDAALQRVAVAAESPPARGRFDLRAVQLEPLRDLNLAAHQVDAGDHFGDGVLHLDARVHLDEIPFAGIGIDQKFDRAGVVVAGRARQLHGGVGQIAARMPASRPTAGATSTTF